MRGFSADIIYLDEMDMIPKEVLDKVINPILATTPDTMLIATSTPIGKKSKFYEWCLERPDFKEDYHPSSVIPHWEQIKEEVSFFSEHKQISNFLFGTENEVILANAIYENTKDNFNPNDFIQQLNYS